MSRRRGGVSQRRGVGLGGARTPPLSGHHGYEGCPRCCWLSARPALTGSSCQLYLRRVCPRSGGRARPSLRNFPGSTANAGAREVRAGRVAGGRPCPGPALLGSARPCPTPLVALQCRADSDCSSRGACAQLVTGCQSWIGPLGRGCVGLSGAQGRLTPRSRLDGRAAEPHVASRPLAGQGVKTTLLQPPVLGSG